MCCLQPDAVTGASRCGLSTPAPHPHGSETIFSFLFPALTTAKNNYIQALYDYNTSTALLEQSMGVPVENE